MPPSACHCSIELLSHSSGKRKSFYDKLAVKPILDWEEAEHAGYLKAKTAYDAEMGRFEATRKRR